MIKKILDFMLKILLGAIALLIYFLLIVSIIYLLALLFKITIIANIFLRFMILVFLILVPIMLYDIGNSAIKDIKRYLKRKGF